MFKRKTVFVVGAGASTEVGLPMGTELKDEIARKLNIRFKDGYTQSSGDGQITEALRIHCRQTGVERGDINPHRQAACEIAQAMPLFISIDNYLHAHSGDERVELCGKLGIASCILEAERRSALWCEPHEKVQSDKVVGTWYQPFFQMLTENVQVSKADSLFENMSIITFNYDRCIEQFLPHALVAYYKMSLNDACEIVKRATILHPYGQVGNLPWQGGYAVDFGAKQNSAVLLQTAGQLKTFTEQNHDESLVAAIHQAVQEAETAVFLGFAFHEINVGLLAAAMPKKVNRIFGTAFGMSDSDVLSAADDVSDAIAAGTPDIQLKKLKCVELFREYWRTMSR